MITVARMALLIAIVAGLAPAQTTAPSDPKQQFIQSLTLRPERFIVDSSHPTIVWLSQLNPAGYTPASTLKMKLSLAPQIAGAAAVKDLGTFEIYSHSLVEKSFAASAELSGVPDGDYRVVAEILDGETSLGTLEKPILLAAGIDVRFADVQRRLALIAGHEGAKASVLYPYDLARVINIGKRNWNAFDLGLNAAMQPNYYDFGKGMQRSENLLKALEAGTDPLWRAKGDNERHYWFAEAGEVMPYRVYVPSTWDGKAPLPMVLILHGNTRDQDFYFDRDDQILKRTAEKHGYMLAAVLGYHPNGGYNAGSRGGRGATTNPAPGAARGIAARGGANQYANDTPRSRIGELSEMDALHVFDLMRAEYPVDPKRTYLFGYSSGGAGAYYLGPKLAENWAAVAIGAGNTSPNGYPFDRLKNVPVLIFNGDKDVEVRPQVSYTMAAAMKEHGIDVEHIEYKGFDHGTAVAAGIPHLFEFFDAHRQK
jgi:poly(3-hydroxybutyrate) depolymerase